jgi:hypothetical protein
MTVGIIKKAQNPRPTCALIIGITDFLRFAHGCKSEREEVTMIVNAAGLAPGENDNAIMLPLIAEKLVADRYRRQFIES